MKTFSVLNLLQRNCKQVKAGYWSITLPESCKTVCNIVKLSNGLYGTTHNMQEHGSFMAALASLCSMYADLLPAQVEALKPVKLANWIFYFKSPKKIPHCGKWMHFFGANHRDHVQDCLFTAVNTGVCEQAKMSAEGSGVACFYLDITDMEAHRRVLRYMLDRGLIQKTQAGRLHNISFKYDAGRLVGEDDQPVKVTLSDFLDLDTGKFY